MLTIVVVKLIQNASATRELNAIIVALNLGCLILQLLEFIAIYDFNIQIDHQLDCGVPFLTASMLGGASMLQLEIRIKFDALFDTESSRSGFWTYRWKFYARVGLAIVHFVLCWPAYLLSSDIIWVDQWHYAGLSIQALSLSIFSFLLAILITQRLILYYKSDPKVEALRYQCNSLIFLLIITLFMDILGILAYTMEAFLIQDSREYMRNLAALADQFAIATLGIEIFCESATLLMVVHLVRSRQADFVPTKSGSLFDETFKSVVSKTCAPREIPTTLSSSLFKNVTLERRCDNGSSLVCNSFTKTSISC
ncbi:hypothetical protein BDEG_23150 [Batrachochytrium dendrobatidis JEL423]|nr:hypothetical protein BDEG_23150 [Batrachochytrium dendrobatidis JEL423]